MDNSRASVARSNATLNSWRCARSSQRIAVAEGATIEKYIGDEIFLLFGAPAAHSDDVARALHVADSIVRKMALSPQTLAVRIGIETGEALVDLQAVDDRQRMAVGTCA